MRFMLGLKSEARLHKAAIQISERNISELRGQKGSFRPLPTPKFAECKPFPIFGELSFDLSSWRALPRRYIATIKNCLIHGQSTAIITRNLRNGTLWVTSPELALDEDPGNYGRFFARKGDQQYILAGNPTLRPTISLDRAILAGTRYSFNYFHFMVNSLVRVIMADENSVEDTVPVLLPNAPPQILDLLRLAWPQRAMIVMASDDLVFARNLIVPSSASFAPDDPEQSKQAVLDASYLPILKARLDQIYTAGSESGSKTIFIKRQLHRNADGHLARTIVNQDDIISFMETIGARIIQPELMTVSAQVDAFRQAEIVVGMAGGALANAIFCKPGAAILVLCQNKVVNPEYIGLMIDALSLRIAVIACEPVAGTSEHPSHLSVTARLSDLTAALDWAHNGASQQ